MKTQRAEVLKRRGFGLCRFSGLGGGGAPRLDTLERTSGISAVGPGTVPCMGCF